MTRTAIILIASNLASFLLLSSYNRVSSFYWIRGSKHCFQTSFSYLNCYFLILVFSCNCYWLVLLCLSWLHGNLFSCPVFSHPWHSKVLPCTCAPIFLAHITRFFNARCLWEPGCRLTTGFLSPFHPLLKVSHANVQWAIVNHTFSSHTISLSWHFLAWHQPPLSQCSTAWARNPQGISKLVNQGWLLLVLWQLLDNFPSALCTSHVPVGSLCFAWCNSVGLPHYKILCSGFLNVPLPVGMHLIVSPKGRHILLDWLSSPTA